MKLKNTHHFLKIESLNAAKNHLLKVKKYFA